MFFACDLLEESKILVGVGMAGAIPIHGKTGDAHADSLINLASHYVGILTRVADVNMSRVAKPGHINREDFWTAAGVPLLQHGAHVIAAGQDHHTGEQQTEKYFGKLGHKSNLHNAGTAWSWRTTQRSAPGVMRTMYCTTTCSS